MAACSSDLSCSSLPNLILPSLNLILFLLSAASLPPILILRAPPSPFGWALLAVSSATLLSSLLSLYSHLTRSNPSFVSHVFLLLISSIGQALGFFALFLRPNPSISFLMSNKSPADVRALAEVEKWAMVGMFVLSSIVLVLECLVQGWWVKEREETEAAMATGKRANNNRRMAKVRVESVAEAEAKEAEDGIESEFGQRV